MDFDSPDVMKNFPGLYASELNKKCSNDSDYSDETEKGMKKDMLISKRKEKKEKKDKERGYAALEGESSDEASKSRSPSKSKKTKAFKFTTKSKEKRDKFREKEMIEKKKDRDKKIEKKTDKEKGKKLKTCVGESIDIAEALPIFGVSIDLAVERSRCHDGVDIPLPVRNCIDYIESVGISFEGVYKVSGTKAKVSQIKKMYNHRKNVNLEEYDVPTATSLLKMYLRDLPEPIFTNEMLIRFEEAGAILNFSTREKHLKILVDNLPFLNRLLLSWLIMHLHNISLNEKQNKMNKQALSAALNHTFHISSRLLHSLLHHCEVLFPNTVVYKYIPPLSSGAQLPDKPLLMEIELKKQESLLTTIHKEMNFGCISGQREELLWEVQRIITQLKRKLKTVQKVKDTSEKPEDIREHENRHTDNEETVDGPKFSNNNNLEQSAAKSDTFSVKSQGGVAQENDLPSKIEPELSSEEEQVEKNDFLFDDDILFLTYKRNGLLNLKDQLTRGMQEEKREIEQLLEHLENSSSLNSVSNVIPKQDCLDDVMNLLEKENKILQIKKINLVREIIEEKEFCIEISAQLKLSGDDKCSTDF